MRPKKRRQCTRPIKPFKYEIHYDLKFIDLEPLDKDAFKQIMDEPHFNCCKGCSNWKGAMTVCNCVLPQMEIDTKYQL